MPTLLTAPCPGTRQTGVDEATTDEVTARAVVGHHAELAAALTERAEALVTLVDTVYLLKAERVRGALLGYLRGEILPHARAEERTLYPPAAALAEGHLLVAGLVEDHRALAALVSELAGTRSPVRAAALAGALATLFTVHQARENDLLLPLLVDAHVPLTDALTGTGDMIGTHDGRTVERLLVGGGDLGGREPVVAAGPAPSDYWLG